MEIWLKDVRRSLEHLISLNVQKVFTVSKRYGIVYTLCGSPSS